MSAPSPSTPLRPSRRIDVVDCARGAALAAMAAYHGLWDLGFLQLTPQNYALTPLGRLAAHGIAGAFLLLVGVGLVLANGDGMRWRPFALRLARIGGAALLITLATRVAFPQSYIFFGILHCIAVSSLLGLPFVFLPAWVAGLGAVAVLLAPRVVAHPLLDAPEFYFLGLGRGLPDSNDWVPLFPWFGVVLAGIALARLVRPALAGSAFARWRAGNAVARGAAFAGRHSLAVYLIHQPVLLALFTGLVMLTGPHPKAGLASFRKDYVAHCTRTGGEAKACRIAARCTADALRLEGLWGSDKPYSPEERAKAQGLSQRCYEAAEGTAAPP